MATRAERKLRSNLRRLANETTRKLREDCPVRSGTMRRSITQRQRGQSYDIGARVEYRYWVSSYKRAVRAARRAARRKVNRQRMTIQTREGTRSGSSYIDVRLVDRRTAIQITGEL